MSALRFRVVRSVVTAFATELIISILVGCNSFENSTQESGVPGWLLR